MLKSILALLSASGFTYGATETADMIIETANASVAVYASAADILMLDYGIMSGDSEKIMYKQAQKLRPAVDELYSGGIEEKFVMAELTAR